MAPLVLLINVSKIVGVASILTVAANALAFRCFRKKNLAPFENPIDELQDILAVFPTDRDVDDGGFFFALATAPAHVEDKLNDAWLQFAKETPPKEEDSKASSKSSEESSGEAEVSDACGQKSDHNEPVGSGKLEEPSSEGERKLETRTDDITGQTGSDASGVAQKPVEDSSTGQVEMSKDTEGCNTPPMDEWEVINQGQEKDKASSEKVPVADPDTIQEIKKDVDDKEISSAESGRQSYRMGSLVGEPFFLYSEEKPESSQETSKDQSQFQRSKVTTEEPTLQFNLPNKGRKLVRVAMEAMIRGYEKLQEEEKTNVAAWHNTANPEQRLRFWSEPDTELRLAQGTNVQFFRMGVDWGRIMPVEPIDGTEKAVDWAALDRYRKIIERVHAHGMRVMLTLFHHSLPPWAGRYGGWREEKTIEYFLDFTRIIVEKLSDLVDFWITFNEPHVFAMLTYCAGAWPGGDPDLLETATSVLPRGVFKKVMHMMAVAHSKAFDFIHDFCKETKKRARVGVSHHVSFMRPYGLFDSLAIMLSDRMTRFSYIDSICNKLDFLGLNYYGQEVVSAPGLKLVENDEYSESGRGVYPDGLYRILLAFHDKYKKLNIPYIITENGVSDATDYIRRPYLLEHLLAVRAAMDKGVPIQGYCFWTTSDNWEWADGYGPKFGLAAVDRENNLARIPRPSYHLFAEVVKTGKVTKEQRDKAWDELQIAAVQGKKRPFCRAVDSHGLMYAGGLDVPIERPFVQRDWRFGHYRLDDLQDPLSRTLKFLSRVPFIGSRNSDGYRQTHDFKYQVITPDPLPSDTEKGNRSEAQEENARVLVVA